MERTALEAEPALKPLHNKLAAAQDNVARLHAKNAARRKSRLMKRLNDADVTRAEPAKPAKPAKPARATKPAAAAKAPAAKPARATKTTKATKPTKATTETKPARTRKASEK